MDNAIVHERTRTRSKIKEGVINNVCTLGNYRVIIRNIVMNEHDYNMVYCFY